MLKENPIDILERKNKSRGFCTKCNPYFHQEEEWGHNPKKCRNILYCAYHKVEGHFPTRKCLLLCFYCRKHGHTMQFCRKLKHCDLCGKRGHNPYRCWRYDTLSQWARRAKKLNRCLQCLTLCTTETNRIDSRGRGL